MTTPIRNVLTFIGIMLMLLTLNPAQAEDSKWIKPYILASDAPGKLSDVVATVKNNVKNSDFTVVGEYSPYKNAHIIVISNNALQQHASQSKFGGYGAAIRIGVTQVGDNVQVSYVNPQWMSGMYRMKTDLADIRASLAKVLGAKKDFGTSELWSREDLEDYHYTVFMPYFTDPLKLAKYDSYSEAVKAVEAGLAANKGGTRKIYSIKIPGKDEMLYGVAIDKNDGSDTTVMTATDIAEYKHTAHLPYDMLVSGNTVYALHGKFRIAQSFPDLTMTTFMKISDAPNAIEEALKKAAGK